MFDSYIVQKYHNGHVYILKRRHYCVDRHPSIHLPIRTMARYGTVKSKA